MFSKSHLLKKHQKASISGKGLRYTQVDRHFSKLMQFKNSVNHDHTTNLLKREMTRQETRISAIATKRLVKGLFLLYCICIVLQRTWKNHARPKVTMRDFNLTLSQVDNTKQCTAT